MTPLQHRESLEGTPATHEHLEALERPLRDIFREHYPDDPRRRTGLESRGGDYRSRRQLGVAALREREAGTT